jgi:hypothetical protein
MGIAAAHTAVFVRVAQQIIRAEWQEIEGYINVVL